MLDMSTRAELEFRSRACMAQLKLRVVAFSMAVTLPPWIVLYILQRMGVKLPTGIVARAFGLLALVAYGFGVFRIFKRTQRDCDLVCPRCKVLLGVELGGISKAGECRRCGEKIVESISE